MGDNLLESGENLDDVYGRGGSPTAPTCESWETRQFPGCYLFKTVAAIGFDVGVDFINSSIEGVNDICAIGNVGKRLFKG